MLPYKNERNNAWSVIGMQYVLIVPGDCSRVPVTTVVYHAIRTLYLIQFNSIQFYPIIIGLISTITFTLQPSGEAMVTGVSPTWCIPRLDYTSLSAWSTCWQATTYCYRYYCSAEDAIRPPMPTFRKYVILEYTQQPKDAGRLSSFYIPVVNFPGEHNLLGTIVMFFFFSMIIFTFQPSS